MNQRVEKVNQLIKKELGKIIFKDFGAFSENLITITQVATSKGYAHAKIYISVYPDDKEQKVLSKLNDNIYTFQKKLDKKLFMRPVPKVSFLLDEKGKQFTRLSKILKKR
jgi:ribosome-binding factor A